MLGKLFMVLIFIFFSCEDPEISENQEKQAPELKSTVCCLFSTEKWSLNGDIQWHDYNLWLKRDSITSDLLENHIKIGMSKKATLKLLGKQDPYPNSIKVLLKTLQSGGFSLNSDNREDLLIYLSGHSKDSILTYRTGFSGSGPNMLTIILDSNSTVSNYFIARAE